MKAELEVNKTARRSVYKIVMMHALNDLNMSILDVYNLSLREASIKDTVMVALKSSDVMVTVRSMVLELKLQDVCGIFFRFQVKTCKKEYCTSSFVSSMY